jgi:hypothetical protein
MFGIGRKDAREAPQDEARRKVPVKVASYEHDHEGKRFRSSNVVYSFWSASKYVLILSLMLWWLPLFGQMIAGYVGGRRAGGPWKGVVAAIIPVVCLWAVMTGFDTGALPSHVGGVAIAPAAISSSLSTSVPFISPYIQFSSEYVGSFVDALEGSSPYGINLYIITIAFAYVGGVLAEQNRREIEFNSGAMVTNTTVLALGEGDPQQPQMYNTHRPGLAHHISGCFPWSRRGDPHVAAAHAGRGNLDRREWSRAVPMTFNDRRGTHASASLPPAQGAEDARGSSGATAPQRQRNVRQHPHMMTAGSDPWIRAERRTRQTFSSASRFAEDRAPTGPRPGPQPHDRHHELAVFRPKSQFQYTPGDPRSIDRARKSIDKEWHQDRKHEQHFQDSHAAAAHREDDGDSAQKKHHEHSGSQWDSI